MQAGKRSLGVYMIHFVSIIGSKSDEHLDSSDSVPRFGHSADQRLGQITARLQLRQVYTVQCR